MSRSVVCSYVVTEANYAEMGRVLSGHHSRRTAHRAAVRCGGMVEYAEVAQMVQHGYDYTRAVQAVAGQPVRAVRVTVAA